MNQQGQEIQLNSMVKVELKPSKIHGIGVFAIRDISMLEKMYLDSMPVVFNFPYSSFGKLFPEVRKVLLERNPQIITGSAFAYPDVRFLSYTNHADSGYGKGTANYDLKNDQSLRDIKKGDEIMMDYRLIDGYKKVYDWLEPKKAVK